MSGAASIPKTLRLVNIDSDVPVAMSREGNTPSETVRNENLAAARIDPTDARWVLAVRVAQLLEGGKAAVLTPDRRRRLVALAVRLGLREFDAALIIAIVQDGARDGLALSADARHRIAFVRAVEEKPGSGAAVLFVAAASLALVLFAAMKAWLLP